jgi:exodeoxyribonuclease VII small subunit
METALTYEAAYAELEEIYQAISNDAVSVDELAEKVKRAAVLVEYCQAKLKSTEEEIGKIIGQLTKSDVG